MNTFQHAPAGEPPEGIGPGGGGFDKSGVLLELVSKWRCRSLVETGLYQGHGSGMPVYAGGRVEQYFAIDYQEENARLGRERLPDATFLVGDSGELLEELLLGDEGELIWTPPSAPCLFWLDAHAISPEEPAPQICPVLGELAAIIRWEHASSSVVAIDDLWGFGSVEGWPSRAELLEAASSGPWEVWHDGAIVYCEPLP